LPRHLLAGQPLQVAEHERHTISLRQAVDLLVERREVIWALAPRVVAGDLERAALLRRVRTVKYVWKAA
jgi:hypothetical protein